LDILEVSNQDRLQVLEPIVFVAKNALTVIDPHQKATKPIMGRLHAEDGASENNTGVGEQGREILENKRSKSRSRKYPTS
jgi:hypothetical protein